MNIGTTIHRMVAASAVAALGLAASAMTTSSYVQDGLVAMWDGNENAGDGQGGHAETLTEWKDTSGRYSFVFNANSGITVEEGALVFPGTDSGYATLSVTATDATFEAARNGTCEVVVWADRSKTTASVALQSSMEAGIALGARVRSSADAIAEILTATGYYNSPYPSYDWFSKVTTLSTTYSSAQPQNTWGNAVKLAVSGGNVWGDFDNATYLGFRAKKTSGQSFKGKIYAIRLYSRQLTAAEIAANRAVDEERFVNGVYGLDDVLLISGNPQQIATSEPSYGGHSYSAGATEKVTVPAVGTNEMNTAVATCTGWKLYDNLGELKGSGESNVCDYTHPTPAAFRNLVWEWQIVGYRLALMGVPPESCTLTVEGDQIDEGFYRTNTVVTLTAKGDLFGGWAGDVPPGHEMDNPLRLTMDSPKSVWVRSTAWVYDEDARTISDGSWTFSVSGARDNLVVGFPKAKGTTTVIDLNRSVLGGGTLTGISDSGSTSDQCWLSQTVPEIRDYVTEVRFADTMRTIPHAAVRGCAALRSVTLPKEVERIEYGAFAENPSLTTVLPAMLPKSLTYLGSNAFKNTPNLNADVVLSNNQLTLQDNTLPSWSIFESSGIVSLDLSAKVKTVPFEFLRRSSKLEKVSYPKTLEALSGAMHADCTGLMDIQFQSYPTNFEAKTDAFYRTPDAGRIVYPKGDSGWNAYLDAHTNDNFTAWDPASPEAQRYLQDFPDGWKPIGRMRIHKGATYGNTYKWMVPHNFGKGLIITFP